MPLPSITKPTDLKGKRVLVRVDLNVPLKKGSVLEDSRLLAAIPTINYLRAQGAKIILVTHVGRPEGKVVSSLKVDPVAKRLSRLLGVMVKKIETKDWKWSDRKVNSFIAQTKKMRPGSVAMLENIRFSPDEEKDKKILAWHLASLADVFVLDGFGVAHRAGSSITGVTHFLPSYAGLLLEKEIKSLEKIMKKPKAPFVVVLGGIKMETKIPVIKHLLPIANTILIGGGILNSYLKAAGYGVGASLVDTKQKKELLQYGKKRNVIIPVDVVVGDLSGKNCRVVQLKKKPHLVCKKDEAILDIGPETIRLFASYIRAAKTLVWNGAMGYFEQKPYDVGTVAIARLVASRAKGTAYGVIGGGETVQVTEQIGMIDDIDFVSTGGGAMLEFLSGAELPGIVALQQKKK